MRIGLIASSVLLGAAIWLGSASHARALVPVRVALSEAAHPTSYVDHGQATGIFKDMLDALFAMVPGYRIEYQGLPWTRAQRLVESGEMDLFVTFPAANRSAYAHFTRASIFTFDYGTIVYDRKGSHARQIESARNFAGLTGLTFVHQDAVEWETENIPASFRRYTVNAPQSLLHMTFERRVGDFFIMYPEQAYFFASQLGYLDQLGVRKAPFIPNSLVRMHIGIRKTFPGSKALIDALDAAMQRPAYQQKASAIRAKYLRRDE